MSQPAARALVDTGAHTAPILMGSTNVFIENFPAARQGDPMTCPAVGHGPAIITGGSSSVFINGKPAARMGDATGCAAPPPPPPPPGVMIPIPPPIPGVVIKGSATVFIGG